MGRFSIFEMIWAVVGTLINIALLFTPQTRFLVHRIFGLAYLIEWFASIYLYLSNYPVYLASPLVWSLPLTGVIQSITAVYYFWFLPKKQDDPGYYSDKSTLSYNFVKENVFFAGLLLFQCIYYTNHITKVLRELIIP